MSGTSSEVASDDSLPDPSDGLRPGRRARLCVTAVIVLVLGAYSAVAVTGSEWFPFSTFPMYRTIMTSPLRVRAYEVVGYDSAGGAHVISVREIRFLMLKRDNHTKPLTGDLPAQMALANDINRRATRLHLPGAPYARVVARRRRYEVRPYPASPTNIRVRQNMSVADSQAGTPAPPDPTSPRIGPHG